jgi:hypothetical protein
MVPPRGVVIGCCGSSTDASTGKLYCSKPGHGRFFKYRKIDNRDFNVVCQENVRCKGNDHVQKILNPTNAMSAHTFVDITRCCVKCRGQIVVTPTKTLNKAKCEKCGLDYAGVKRPLPQNRDLINKVEPLLLVLDSPTIAVDTEDVDCLDKTKILPPAVREEVKYLKLPPPGLFAGKDLTNRAKRLVSGNSVKQEDVGNFGFYYGPPKERMGGGKNNLQRRFLMSVLYRRSLRCVAGLNGKLHGNQVILPETAFLSLGKPDCGILQRFPSIEKRNAVFVNVIATHNGSTIMIPSAIMAGLNCDLDGDAILFVPLNSSEMGNSVHETRLLMSPECNIGSMGSVLKLEFDSDVKLGLGTEWINTYKNLMTYYVCTGNSLVTFNRFSFYEDLGKLQAEKTATWSVIDHIDPSHESLQYMAKTKATRFSNAHLLQIYQQLGYQSFTNITSPVGTHVGSNYMDGLDHTDLMIHYQAGWDSLISRSGNDVAMKGQCYYMLLYCLKSMIVGPDRLTVYNPVTSRIISHDIRLLHPIIIKQNVTMTECTLIHALVVSLAGDNDSLAELEKIVNEMETCSNRVGTEGIFRNTFEHAVYNSHVFRKLVV